MPIRTSLTRFSALLRQFAVKHNMVCESMLKDQHTFPLPISLAFMLLLPIMAFGALSGPVAAIAAPRHPLAVFAVGVLSTAALFVLTRVVVRLIAPLWNGGWTTGKSANFEFARAVVVTLLTMVVYFLTPAAVLLVMSQLFPSYVAVPQLASGFLVLCADCVLGNLTGVRLFFPFPATSRSDAGKQDDQPKA